MIPTIRVAIVENHALVRAGLKLAIDAQPDMQVVAESSEVQPILLGMRSTPADVMVVNYAAVKCLGGSTMSQLKSTSGRPAALVLSAYGEDDLVIEVIRAGAAGFLLTSTDSDGLLEGIRKVAAGVPVLSPEMLPALWKWVARDEPPSPMSLPPGLTHRELEILKLIGSGLSNREIAQALVVSNATVKSHVNRILNKTGLQDRVALVVLAFKSKLVE